MPTETLTPTPTHTPTNTATPTPTFTPTPSPTPDPQDRLEYFALIYLEKEPYPDIEIELFIDKAPNTVNNFVKLVRNGFYDGLTFHLVVPGELVQTGDPTSTGDGGPGYAIEDEFHPDLRHDAAGVVAMANFGNPPNGTNGSQFYVTLAPLPHRDGLNPDGSTKDCENDNIACHSVFGKVIKGMHLIDSSADQPHHNAVREGDAIRKIEIVTQFTPGSPSVSKPPDCSNNIAVARPEQNPGLVRHCEILLNVKRSLAGEAKLNWSDQIPIWEWHGITIVDPRTPLINLELHRRGLTGSIPKELSELTGLSRLDLAQNALTGTIPHEISNLLRLVELNLETNQLSGPIPTAVTQLPSLASLVLSFNELTGTIPPEIGNLRDLEVLGLYRNNLTGGIPPEIGQLTGLRVLDIGENRLKGRIPDELSNLTRLEEIWLNASQLAGDFPGYLAELTNLRALNIGRNFLTGSIPTSLGENQRFDDIQLFPNDLEGCLPDHLKQYDLHEVQLRFCSDPPAWYRPADLFEGGVDLTVTHIERLPRYPSYQVVYYESQAHCPYPFDEPLGPVLCNDDAEIKRNPESGDIVQLVAHVRNFGDTNATQFDYVWRVDGDAVETGTHDPLNAGEATELFLDFTWPDKNGNPIVSFEVDPANDVVELLEDNNSIDDWIKGHTIGVYFSAEAYESLKISNEPGSAIQSPVHWFHNNVDRLNEMLVNVGVEDRVRTELYLVAEQRNLDATHDLRRYLDGWWGIWHDTSAYSLEGYRGRMEIDGGLLHELLHQLGLIDIYQMILWDDQLSLPDANRPGKLAGCGFDYWKAESDCFAFPPEIHDIMIDETVLSIGDHTAGGLRANIGHRRGFYGEYLYDTPATTTIKIVDENGNPLSNVELRFYQSEEWFIGDHTLPFVDDIVEFTVSTNDDGIATPPNRGITGIQTVTGHQLRPNPFGVISVNGTNGLFIIEMIGEECTNYEWLTLVELNIAYWDGQTDHAEFTKTLSCPPP